MSFYKGIFTVRLNQDLKGTSAQAWEWINCVQDMKDQLGRPFPLMTVVNYKVDLTSKARRILRRSEDEEQLIADARVVNSIRMKAMVKFLSILVPRNLHDEDVFLQEENAVAWLNQRIDRSYHNRITQEEASSLRLQIRSDSE